MVTKVVAGPFFVLLDRTPFRAVAGVVARSAAGTFPFCILLCDEQAASTDMRVGEK